MEVKDIKINQLIEITVDEEDTDYKNLPSRIEEVTEQYFHISVPMRKGELLPLRVGQYLKINFVCRGRSFMFKTVVVNRRLNPLPVLIVNKPAQLQEIQRRRWVRVPVKIELRFRKMADDGEIQPFEGSTVDISGGGIQFVTLDAVEAGDILELEIDLPNSRPVFCRAKVLRVLERATKKGQFNKAILEYQEISEGQRDRIIKFVFEKQREWIRRGIL